MTLELHPLCSLFPEMTATEFAELVTDMKINGFRKNKKIVTLDGKVLEGRNRMNAAEAAGVKPEFEKFKGKDPLDFVIAENFNRRHLTSSQRAMIAADISTRRNSDVTTAEAAGKMNVARDSVQTAKKVKKASKSLAKKVKSGKMSLHAAEKQIASKSKRGGLYAVSLELKAEAADVSTSEKKDTRTTGQIAHDAYLKKLGPDCHTEWESESPLVRSAWQFAADAVKGKI